MINLFTKRSSGETMPMPRLGSHDVRSWGVVVIRSLCSLSSREKTNYLDKKSVCDVELNWW